MGRRAPETAHPEDLPWNDAPADSAAAFGSEEPDPAEVDGDEGEEVDVSRRVTSGRVDAYRRETLNERLAEEEPDRLVEEQEPEAGEFQLPEGGRDDIRLEPAEVDLPEPGDVGVVAAEDAAVHVRNRPRL